MKTNYSVLSFLILFILVSCSEKTDKKPEPTDLLTYVDPFIGTGFHGHTFPGPVMPHGMLQLSPDTKLNGWDASSGYHYDDNTIYGFSHTHLSGTGIGDLGDILLLPYTGTSKKKPVATFNKEDEISKVGYYSVKFNNYDVKAELTASTRTGLHRYHFNGDQEKKVLLDIGHILQRTWGHSNVYNEFEIIDNKTIKGLKHSQGWAHNHKVYFYAEFSSPFKIDSVNTDGKKAKESRIYKGKNVYARLSFDQLKENEPLLIKVSISPVDTQGARKNMKAEMNYWDFDRVRKDNEDAWRKSLEKIKVSSGNKDDLIIFYTALYHSMIAPMIYQDVDGRYRGMDKKIHTAKEGQINYTVYSLWDTFRALHPLMTIIDEKKSGEWVNNLILKYQEGGILPMWPLASNYTGTMVGYPAVANIADALTKNIPGIDTELAFEASANSAFYKPWLVENTDNERKKALMPIYNKYVSDGTYIPADKAVKSVSFGLEMAYYDWCIAQLGELSHKKTLTDLFKERAKYYQFYFDKQTGFMRGKNSDGKWVTPFDPKYSSHERSQYVEGNAWQWTWFVPHDIEDLINLYGEKENFIQKLDTLFTTSSKISGENASADITGLIGQYAHGNEPSHHVAYLYNYAGQPWKTQIIVDKIFKEFYSTKPDGIVGNEDCGQMSAWYILSSMGFYQVAPGNPVYTIGRPLFDKVEIPLENGKTFTIITKNNSHDNLFIQEIYLNGEKLEKPFFSHKDLMNGSTLKIIMGDNPKK